ncbi:hypothetical protein CEP54_007248 [Fusarium duplospermum]|uniref:Zn(2)-C6 fungal-type domain-containing protein n=1 Tax=Fusarium duplospermum TaxID=1325734 RepID=A0A428Q2P4_9HYPO|nr:hypothetical protein CEP54_007248 [Fusarium duplospermum]
MPPQRATGQARTSCSRCHKRKKRCDRGLPQCENCRRAFIACSFLNDDRNTASYPIAYVRELENRVQHLENNLSYLRHTSPRAGAGEPPSASAVTQAATAVQVTPSADPATSDAAVAPGQDCVQDLPLQAQDGEWGSLVMSSEDAMLPALPSPPQTLDGELKHLSLEATAERHLGSSSGLSFAKLTQTVLRRLTPDRADFFFGNDGDQDMLARLNIGSPSDLFNSPMSDNLGVSMPCDPTWVNDFVFNDITEPDHHPANMSIPTDQSHVNSLVDFYFAHSHTLYPVVDRAEVLSTLRCVREEPHSSWAQSPLCLFRMWMVLAIGSTAYCSISLADESESMLYYNKALTYFEPALGLGDMAALEVIILQVSYSFFNQLGPNTWFLVGMATRIALGMGLQSSSSCEGLPFDVIEKRKRVFFSLYMMDRVVSTALGRPFAVHDDDIDILPFAAVDDENIKPDGIQPQTSLNPSIMAIPLHILALRRISSKINRQVYSNPDTPRLTLAEREEIIRSLHKELIQWRRDMPFPLPKVDVQVPHLTSTWYDFNYYTHLAMLYRPTPLFPTLDQTRIKTLAEAASLSIRHASSMHQQGRLAFNWLNFLALYTSTISLVYSVTAQPDDLCKVLEETRATDDLRLSIELFDTLGIKFVTARKIKAIFSKIVEKYEGYPTT